MRSMKWRFRAVEQVGESLLLTASNAGWMRRWMGQVAMQPDNGKKRRGRGGECVVWKRRLSSSQSLTHCLQQIQSFAAVARIGAQQSSNRGDGDTGDTGSSRAANRRQDLDCASMPSELATTSLSLVVLALSLASRSQRLSPFAHLLPNPSPSHVAHVVDEVYSDIHEG